MKDKTPLKIIAVIVIPLFIAIVVRFADIQRWYSDDDSEEDEIEQAGNAGENDPVIIKASWTLPEGLLEVSGISMIDSGRIAAVQDEAGKIFVYNIKLNKIDTAITFAGDGDYEGIAIVGHSAYILRADGCIYEVSRYLSPDAAVRIYKTHLTNKQDSESLVYDKKNHRLLVAIKAEDPVSADYKGIYAFDLNTKKMATAPVYKIDIHHSIFAAVNKGKPEDSISPSDIAIDPLSGNLYVLEGTKPKLLIMDPKGTIIALHDLEKSEFPQPEGLTFSPDGKLFISNEGAEQSATLLYVEVDNIIP